jgi:hypothetical protein
MDAAQGKWVSRPSLCSAMLSFGVVWDGCPERVVAFHDRWVDAVRYYAYVYRARYGVWPADAEVLELEVPKLVAFDAVTKGHLRRRDDDGIMSWQWCDNLDITNLHRVWRNVKLNVDAATMRELLGHVLLRCPTFVPYRRMR